MVTRQLLAPATLALFSTVAAAAPVFGTAPAANNGGLLPVDKAFVLDAPSKSGKTLTLRWAIQPGYYLYQDRIKVTVDAPSGIKLAAPQFPKGEVKDDPEFGEVTVFHDDLTLRYALPAKGAQPKTLRIKYQGCADAGLCYPPQTRIVALP